MGDGFCRTTQERCSSATATTVLTMPEQFCRCRTEGIATLTPEAQDVFGKTYAEPDELWLGVFFSPSDASQAAGRKYLQRFGRARSTAIPRGAMQSHLPRLPLWGTGRTNPMPIWGHRAADSRGERRQRRHHLFGELVHPAAEPAERAAHPLSRCQSRVAVPVFGEFVAHVTQFLEGCGSTAGAAAHHATPPYEEPRP
jgi:hypothetical protein